MLNCTVCALWEALREEVYYLVVYKDSSAGPIRSKAQQSLPIWLTICKYAPQLPTLTSRRKLLYNFDTNAFEEGVGRKFLFWDRPN